MAAKEYHCEVKGFRMITPTVFETTFETHEPVIFEAGQFISIVIPGAGPKGRDLRRAYSIASAPETRPVELCVKLVGEGPGTNYLYQLRPGDKFRGYAAYGDFTYEHKAGRNACFISTGTGIAPFRSMVLSEAFKANPPKHTWCLLGVREENELLYVEELSQLKGIEFVPTVSRPTSSEWKGFKGRVTDFLRAQEATFPWLETEFYLCGSGAMIDEMKLLLAGKGVERESVHQEVYYKPPKDAVTAVPATTTS